MGRIILSICSGDALNEFHFFRETKIDPDVSFVFYDPIYKDDIELRILIRELYRVFFPINFVYFCKNVDDIKSLLEAEGHVPIFLIGFNIQEMYPIIFNCKDIESYIIQERKKKGLLNVCRLIPEKYRDLKVHIQMGDKIVFDNFDSFYQDLILNS